MAIKLSIGRRNKLVTDTLDRVVRGASKLLLPVMATKLHFSASNFIVKEVPDVTPYQRRCQSFITKMTLLDSLSGLEINLLGKCI